MKSVCKYAIIFPVSIQIFGNAVLFSDFRFCEEILTNDEKGKEPHSQAFLGGKEKRKDKRKLEKCAFVEQNV